MTEKNDALSVDNVEVRPLSDEDLDSVAGGAASGPIIIYSTAANSCCPQSSSSET